MNTIFALLLVAQVSLSSPGFVDQLAAPVAASAGPSYLLEEGFEGTGYETSWTESSGNPDPDYATSPAPLVGSQSWMAYDEGTNQRADSAAFADTANTWAFFYVNFVSFPAGTETFFVFRNSTTEMCSVQVTSGGGLRLTMTGGNSAATTATMSAGTTYKVRARYTAGGGANGFGSVEFVAAAGTFDDSGTDYVQKADSTATLGTANIRLRSDSAFQVIMDRVLVDDAEITSSP